MNTVIAIDSFKGSLSSLQAGNAAAEGIKRVFENAKINVVPIADGGEGTAETLTLFKGGKLESVEVLNPLGEKTTASYGIIGKTAVLEMASASGISLISENKRNPLNTTTFGVGMMIKDAINKGCRDFIVGIGGSATNDCGLGMLTALGFEFFDKDGNKTGFFGRNLENVFSVSDNKVIPELKECSFSVACDVKNPLCGDNGCSVVYGPQKGATPEIAEKMDEWILNFSEISRKIKTDSDKDYPGSGAAGGLGFAFMTYLGGKLESGIDMVIRETGIENFIKDADFVVTGEGRLDGQSYMGKVPTGIAKLAKKYNKTVISFSGCVTDEAKLCNSYGIDAFFPILKAPCSLSDAMNIENATNNLSDTAEQVFRLIKICQ